MVNIYRTLTKLCLAGGLSACVGLSACGSPLVDAYSGIQESAAEVRKPEGRLLGKTGDVHVTEARFAYADGQRVVDSEKLSRVDTGVRRLYIQKHLLRQLVIERGLDEGIYNTPEAAAFLLPRLERAMEEYYYHQAGNFDHIEAEVKELRPDDATLARFAKTDPAVRKAGLGQDAVAAETDRILGRLAEVRMSRARQKIMSRLLKENPPMEIHP